MTAEPELEVLRTSTPSCAGVGLFLGAPLRLEAASGEPTLAGWATWAEVAEAATALLTEAPVACGEVLMRLASALVLLEQREHGAVVVIIELASAPAGAPAGAGGGAGMALMRARMAASKVKTLAPEPATPAAPPVTSASPEEGAP